MGAHPLTAPAQRASLGLIYRKEPQTHPTTQNPTCTRQTLSLNSTEAQMSCTGTAKHHTTTSAPAQANNVRQPSSVFDGYVVLHALIFFSGHKLFFLAIDPLPLPAQYQQASMPWPIGLQPVDPTLEGGVGSETQRGRLRTAFGKRRVDSKKQSNDPGNNQHILNTPIIGRR